MTVYWLQQTDADVPLDDDWLAPAELARASQFRSPKRRADFRLGRWTAKRAIAEYLGRRFEDIEIQVKPSGAPDTPGASISISHRAGSALCAVGPVGAAIGCDLEFIEPRSAPFINDYLTFEERRLVRLSNNRDLYANLIWSAKESALKATGEGLTADPRDVEIRLLDRAAPGWRRLTAGPFRGWWAQAGRFVRTIVSDQVESAVDSPPIELGQTLAILRSCPAVRSSCGSGH